METWLITAKILRLLVRIGLRFLIVWKQHFAWAYLGAEPSILPYTRVRSSFLLTTITTTVRNKKSLNPNFEYSNIDIKGRVPI